MDPRRSFYRISPEIYLGRMMSYASLAFRVNEYSFAVCLVRKMFIIYSSELFIKRDASRPIFLYQGSKASVPSWFETQQKLMPRRRVFYATVLVIISFAVIGFGPGVIASKFCGQAS